MRFYNNFLMPSKLHEYERILYNAKHSGYEFHTILSFEKVRNNIDNQKKYLILRCDVDTPDYKVLKGFLALERKYDAVSSYYFRLSTVNYKFMREVEDAKGEASYHYEEIATYCYEKRIKSKHLIDSNIEEIRSLFKKNFKTFKEKSGLPCLTIASHGEFVNIKLGVPNKYLINSDIKDELGILREAYDNEHFDKLTCRIADHSSKDFTNEALIAIDRGERVLELLTHPRQWRSAIWINLKMDITRFYKGIRYKYL